MMMIPFLLAIKDMNTFYSAEDLESEWKIITESLLFQDHPHSILSTSQLNELKILQDFIFLLYKDCKKALLSPIQTLSFIDIVQQCFKDIMKSNESEDIESNTTVMFQSLVRKKHY